MRFRLLAVLLGIVFAPLARAESSTAIFSGGCFWGMEEFFRKVPGVLATRVGYAGGTVKNPSYDQVSSGTTGHAESVELTFDAKKVSYEALLVLFFKMHDPTQLNGQGNDLGTQYRSAIFTRDAGQRRIAEQVKAKAAKAWGKPVTTQIAPAATFYPAETYHQKYLVKNPGGYDNHSLRDLKFD